jgi:hypothetical protein
LAHSSLSALLSREVEVSKENDKWIKFIVVNCSLYEMCKFCDFIVHFVI